MNIVNCPHVNGRYGAHGMCRTCYNKSREKRTPKWGKASGVKGRPRGSQDALRRQAGTCPHPDRPVRARGMCGPCYVTDMRERRIEPLIPNLGEIIEDMEFLNLTLVGAAHMFKTTEERLAKRLVNAGRKDLVPDE